MQAPTIASAIRGGAQTFVTPKHMPPLNPMQKIRYKETMLLKIFGISKRVKIPTIRPAHKLIIAGLVIVCIIVFMLLDHVTGDLLNCITHLFLIKIPLFMPRVNSFT